MRHLIFGDVRFCFSTHKDTILAESKRESEGETVTNFVIIVNMPLSPVPSSSRRGTSPETRFSIQSLAPPPPHNQSNFKVASVRKAQNVASLATQLVHPFSSWFFFFFFFFLLSLSLVFSWVFCWHFLFDTGVPLRFTAAISPGFTSGFVLLPCLSMPGRLSWLPLVSRKM